MSTTISLCNNLTEVTSVTSTVSPPLSSSDWSILSATAPPRAAATPLVTFDRNEGISNGKTWVFTTTFVVDGVEVSLQEQVTGTLVGSKLSQSMTAGSTSTGFVDTNAPKSISFVGQSGATYAVSWTMVTNGLGYDDITYTISTVAPAYKRITPVMQQIETVVVMMFENRSLDTVLGWLYQNGKPALVIPAGSSPSFDGIPPGASNTHHGDTFTPAMGTESYPQPFRVPAYDPGEEMPHVLSQLYADAYGKTPGGYVWASTPTMTGFAWDYDNLGVSPVAEVMGAYSPSDLPVLSGLATHFAVSDAWFSSVPSQTFPNRAFSICGTSRGGEVNGDITNQTFADATTIFNVLGDVGKTWGIYWQMDEPLGTGEPETEKSWTPFTPYFFPMATKAPNGHVDSYRTFLQSAAAGTLPNFCFLEPFWGGGVGVRGDDTAWVGIQGNDYHPPAWVGPAEASLNQLYEALKASPQWSRMLFVILFDEHGGTWDHVPPPVAQRPDGSVGKSGFRFDRLGVRVPALLVSPFVTPGTVFRAPNGAYDHTSFLATLCKWAGVDPASSNLGARTATAPTFEGVLQTEARTSFPTFTVPAGYAQQGGGVGTFLGMSPTSGVGLDFVAFRRVLDSAESPEAFVAGMGKLFSGK